MSAEKKKAKANDDERARTFRFPQALLEKLEERAAAERRSAQQQLVWILETALSQQ